MSESELVSAILEALDVEPGVAAWRNSVGARGFRHFGLGAGSADIIAVVGPLGRFVGLEAKTHEGVQSQEQIAFGMLVWGNGGVYAVVRSVGEARQVIADARKPIGTVPTPSPRARIPAANEFWDPDGRCTKCRPTKDFVITHRWPEGAETVRRLDCPTCARSYIEGELDKP